MSVSQMHPSTAPSGRFWLSSYPDGMAGEIAPLAHASIGALVESCCARFADRPAFTSMGKTLTFRVPERMGFVNITPSVEESLRESGVREGLCLVNAMHITASVFINDDEPRSTRARSGITTTAAARTTGTLTTNVKSWDGKR